MYSSFSWPWTFVLHILILLSCFALTDSRLLSHHDQLLQRLDTGNDYQLLQRNSKQPSNSSYLQANTTQFFVNSTSLPDVDFDIGESYAGLLSISEDLSILERLFFWFFPSSSATSRDEIVIWLNGGPGCSSLEGLLQENGPFLWQYGTYKPVPNPWSWSRLTNIVYIEQPIGTGFSTGTPSIHDENELSHQFMGFWKNFVDLFGLHGFKVYITGESYAGMYCPYIGSAFLDAQDATYFNVSGMLIYDPLIGNAISDRNIAAVPFVDQHKSLFPLNDSFAGNMHRLHESCGFQHRLTTYLTFPPPGPQPDLGTMNLTDECQGLWTSIYTEMFPINPCFDEYQVATTCPLLWDVLGAPGSLSYLPKGAEVYFDRADVKKAIHVHENQSWSECSGGIFQDNIDASDPSSWAAIPRVIDATQNVIIGHGQLDFVLISNQTLLAIQNMTWGGLQGFQSAPSEPFLVPQHALSTYAAITATNDQSQLATLTGAGVMGTTHTERGLTFVTINMAGHMVPQYAPSAAYRHLEVLLGRVDSLESNEPFTE
ncbi:hypothetical protein PFICI_12307 [Pestalotiopsis fici W106-1]|uniref:Carboxypeptidase n=1 Tax=Pestalotiopsis fici (strain W106-1 / CGMCC3.15140) TaxID=1229662 RepID=W3WNC9_PESFW|nr:uncharacterized protein PFICI_12307 [Pestalotiopsis fici W106-1]ETS75363.1 hypothetical protein PFICI_12307 [Pestalotiopsis fici W106-1]